MNHPAALEITVKIQRDELLRLLDTMTPFAEQTITTRARISEILAHAANPLLTGESPSDGVPQLLDDGFALITECPSVLNLLRAR